MRERGLTSNLTAEAKTFHGATEYQQSAAPLDTRPTFPPKRRRSHGRQSLFKVFGTFRAKEWKFLFEASAGAVVENDGRHTWHLTKRVTMSPVMAGLDATLENLSRRLAAAAISLHRHRHRRARLPCGRQHHGH